VKTTAIVLAAVCFVPACSSSNSGAPSVDGNWLNVKTDGSGQGLGLDLKSDGTYALGFLVLTSSTSADAQVETGTFTAQNGTLTFTPQEWSCTGKDPSYSLPYQFSGSDLLVNTGTSIIALQPNTSTVMGSFVDTIGCFNTTFTSFTPQALAPVTP
jgi:hypothetical protein